MMQTGTYLIKHADRFLGLRHQKQTFINLHDSTSIFTLTKESGAYYLKTRNNQFITPGPDMEIILQPRRNSASALRLEDTDTPGQFCLNTSSGTYITGSRYELRQSENKTEDCKLGFLDLSSVSEDEPEWGIWAGQNENELTPPDEAIKEQGFQHKAPTAGVFNWILNNISKSLNYLNRKRLQQRQDHEQLDDYVRRRILDTNEDIGDAIRAAEAAQSATELALADAETARDGAGSSETAAREYAASALSSKNSASASRTSATTSASSAATDADRAESAKQSAERDAETAATNKDAAVSAAEAAEADAETAANSASGAATSQRSAKLAAEQAKAAKTSAASSEHAANSHKNIAKSHSDNSYSSYTKSHTSANKAKTSENNAARSATAAAGSASAASGSAQTAANHAEEAKQDYSNISGWISQFSSQHDLFQTEFDISAQPTAKHILTQHVNTASRAIMVTVNFSGSWIKTTANKVELYLHFSGWGLSQKIDINIETAYESSGKRIARLQGSYVFWSKPTMGRRGHLQVWMRNVPGLDIAIKGYVTIAVM